MKKITLLIAVLGFAVLLGGCPYRPPVQQGNILTRAQIKELKIGMTQMEVQQLLGKPILKNAFNDRCWSYVYTKQISGEKMVSKRVILYFRNERLVRIGN